MIEMTTNFVATLHADGIKNNFYKAGHFYGLKMLGSTNRTCPLNEDKRMEF